MQEYWSVQQLANHLNVSVDCVRNWLKKGLLTRTKAGRRTLVSHSALQDFLQRSTAAAEKAHRGEAA